MNVEDAKAFARALGHRESIEGAASLAISGNIVSLQYHMALQWPWPRQFAYCLEYVAVASAAELAESIDSGQELVVSLFHPDLEVQEEILEESGLTRAWLSPIMGRDLSQACPRLPSPHIEICEVTSRKDRLRFNSVQGISNHSETLDDHIHYFYIELEAKVVAKGQLIYLGDGTAYISDLYTSRSHRQQGLCTAMMSVLEDKARSLGAERAVLAPGLEQIKMKLYERFGYSCTATRSVLIPIEDPEGAA